MAPEGPGSGAEPTTPRPPDATALPQALLREDGSSSVQDPNPASALHGRGSYGTIGPQGELRLDALETVYLTEMQRLRVVGSSGGSVAFRELLSGASARDAGFEIRYLVYRDLRQRGYAVLAGPPPVEFSVLPRGGAAGKTPSRWWVEARSERTPFSLPRMWEDLGKVHGSRRTLLAGVVDEESDLTYYRVREVAPSGTAARPDPPPRAQGIVLEDRVSVFEPGQAQALDTSEHFGSRVGERLELSLLEALYLGHDGRLSLRSARDGGALSVPEFEQAALRTEPDLLARLPVYRHLRSLGLVPKTGFKYGTHFRAYESDPESTHARYLVHVVPPAWEAPWPDVARGVRLAQGVRKVFLLACVPPAGGGETPRYLQLERIRP
jgi:tRNA-intron endonuclease, archaea type